MSDTLLCGKVTENDGEIVSVALWSVTEFVPLGSPEHREMVAQSAATQANRNNNLPVIMPSESAAQKLRILPVETPESKLVGRAERAKTWRWLV